MPGMRKVSQADYSAALKWIARLLAENRIKYNAMGGLAARAYGAKRMLVDIDLSMSRGSMERLAKLAGEYVVEKPWNGTSPTGLWKGYYMELDYAGIAIEISESEKTKIFNRKTKKWEKFPDGLKDSARKRILGAIVPVMPRQNLADYKRKLGRKVDVLDLKSIGR